MLRAVERMITNPQGPTARYQPEEPRTRLAMAPAIQGKDIEEGRGLARRRGAPPRVLTCSMSRAPGSRITESVAAQCCHEIPPCTEPVGDLVGSTCKPASVERAARPWLMSGFSCATRQGSQSSRHLSGATGARHRTRHSAPWPAWLMVRWLQRRRDSTGPKRSTLVVLLVNVHGRPRHRGNGSGPGRPLRERIWPACQLYHRRTTLS